MKVLFNMISDERLCVFDLNDPRDVKNLGYSKEEWLKLTDDEKSAALKEWVDSLIVSYYEEKE